MKIAIITDSGSGLTKAQAQDLGIFYLPLQIIIENQMYLDGENIYVKDVYNALKNGAMPTTSMPLILHIEELFHELKESGYEAIIAIPLSSGLSSTSSIMQATAKTCDIDLRLLEIYTTCEIQKYLATSAQSLVNAGLGVDEIFERLEKSVRLSSTLIIPDDLQHLKRGGRLTPLAATLGGLLKIKPILLLDQSTQGKIDVYDKVRTMSKALNVAVQTFQTKNLDETYELVILHSDAVDFANQLKMMSDQAFLNIHLTFGLIGPVISAHTGLGCVGMQYIKKVEGVDS